MSVGVTTLFSKQEIVDCSWVLWHAHCFNKVASEV